MSISIHTYSDPYKLDREPYWNIVRRSPCFCSSQTLANGMFAIYGNSLGDRAPATVKRLSDALFGDWGSLTRSLEQHSFVDAAIEELRSSGEISDTVANAFKFNMTEVVDSLRVLSELDIDTAAINRTVLPDSQKVLVRLYDSLGGKGGVFDIDRPFDTAAVDAALAEALRIVPEDPKFKSIDFGTVVIQGVHQFSSETLRAVEELSKFKDVLLLFNYQPQYKRVYQTWLDVYDSFGRPVEDPNGSEFEPDPSLKISYEGNVLADRMGRLLDGAPSGPNKPFELIEFGSVTEFAGYVAEAYEEAVKRDSEEPIRAMREQFYAADDTVNDILRLFFPKQFGEPDFCDFPLGRFFVTLANMWDPDNHSLVISDESELRDCLCAGVFPESRRGELVGALAKTSALLDGCSSPSQFSRRVKKALRGKANLPEGTSGHISYLAGDTSDIATLLRALDELDDTARDLFEDFSESRGDLGRFAGRAASVIGRALRRSPSMTDEARRSAHEVYENIRKAEELRASGSFDCLKAALPIILSQDNGEKTSANWIVRNFAQIDGDIMRSKRDQRVTYHFACLSDEDMAADGTARYHWPLDQDFFCFAFEPLDWKCQAFVRAKSEARHFRTYALLFGMEFNRSRFRLSYVKRGGRHDKSPYFLLKILGASVVPYDHTKHPKRPASTDGIEARGARASGFDEFDLYRLRLCRHRFLLETLVRGDTVYSDSFLIKKYCETLVECMTRRDLANAPKSRNLITDKVDEALSSISGALPFLSEAEKLDIVGGVSQKLLSIKSSRLPPFGKNEERDDVLRQLFIRTSLPAGRRGDVLKDKFVRVSNQDLDELLSDEALGAVKFKRDVDLWCKFCPLRQLCAPGDFEERA